MAEKQSSHLDPSNNTINPFSISSIKMKTSMGLAGKSFRSQDICEDYNLNSSDSVLEADEKNPAKLGLTSIFNVISIPIPERTSNSSIGVIQLYNKSFTPPTD